MSTNIAPRRAARTFYGDPQHETGERTDPQRLTVSALSPQSERVLYDYARTSGPDRARAYADALSADAGTV